MDVRYDDDTPVFFQIYFLYINHSFILPYKFIFVPKFFVLFNRSDTPIPINECKIPYKDKSNVTPPFPPMIEITKKYKLIKRTKIATMSITFSNSNQPLITKFTIDCTEKSFHTFSYFFRNHNHFWF